MPSACSGFSFQGQPPAVLPATAFGQGLTFRYVQTPQVWAISGDVAYGFDGRNGDPSSTVTEVALVATLGTETIRFSITRPAAGGIGLDYTRLALVSAPVLGMNRQYQCAIGVSTFATDLAGSPSGAYRRGGLLATAYVHDGSTARAHLLDHSVVSISADQTARRVNISLRLIGTAIETVAPDVELGTFTASAPIDPITGNFIAILASNAGGAIGTVSGRFFGPQAIEIGAALGGSASSTSSAPGFSFAGALYGIR